jgi:DNA-directed RNA polymerase subunit RPC12/RpoP
MKKCCRCGKDLFGGTSGDFWAKGAAWTGVLAGGPITMALGAGYLGLKAFKKHIHDEVQLKCPHCGSNNTVTKDEYEKYKK